MRRERPDPLTCAARHAAKVRRSPELRREDTLLASCSDCGRLHKPECPLNLNPVCAPCTGRYLMTSLEMSPSCPLSHVSIDDEVKRLAPGSYALGYMDEDRFVPFFVGRADSDVNEQLHAWVGRDSRSTRYGPPARAAYGSRRRGDFLPGAPALAPVEVAVDASYTHFAFRYASSAEAAFEAECESYHDLGGSFGLDNAKHPAPTGGARWHCPAHGAQRT